jgi:hypothetical protein
VEKLGAGSGTDGVQTRPESALELIGASPRIGLDGLLADGMDGVAEDAALSACQGVDRM